MRSYFVFEEVTVSLQRAVLIQWGRRCAAARDDYNAAGTVQEFRPNSEVTMHSTRDSRNQAAENSGQISPSILPGISL